MCDETKIVFDLLKDRIKKGTVIDVGAFDGGTVRKFVNIQWNSYAFEPNPERYQYIEKFIEKNPDKKKYLTLEKKCVNNIEEDNLIFYLSDQSKGISSLTNFHKTHFKANFTTSSIRLDNYIKSKNIKHVNFLKIDTEGHDYFVLQSYPWELDKPDVIECEFEDLKTVDKLNYSWKDMAEYLKDKGYYVIVSEWFPIVRYGITHKWRNFKEYPCELEDYKAWGNFICFRDYELYNNFKNIYINSIPNNLVIYDINNNNNLSKYFKDFGFNCQKNINNIDQNKIIYIDGINFDRNNILNKNFKNNEFISTLYLVYNQNVDLFYKEYNLKKKRIYTDNIFIKEKLKNNIPIFLSLPIIDYLNPIEYNEIIVFSDLKNSSIQTKEKIITIKNNMKAKFNIVRLYDNIKEYSNNIFNESSVILYLNDIFNCNKICKKIINSIVQNKIIILKNKETYILKLLRLIKYPNYILFDNLEEIENIINNINLENLKYFDSKILEGICCYFKKNDIINKFFKFQNKTVIIKGIDHKNFTVNYGMNKYPIINTNIDNLKEINVQMYDKFNIDNFNNIYRKINNNKNKIFFIRKNFKELCDENLLYIENHNIYYLEDMNHILFKINKKIYTELLSVIFAIFLGYTDIRIIGFDEKILNFLVSYIKDLKKIKEYNYVTITNYSNKNKIGLLNKNINKIFD